MRASPYATEKSFANFSSVRFTSPISEELFLKSMPSWCKSRRRSGPTPGADAGPLPAQNLGPVPAQMWRSNLVRLERVSRHCMDELHMSTRMRAYPQ